MNVKGRLDRLEKTSGQVPESHEDKLIRFIRSMSDPQQMAANAKDEEAQLRAEVFAWFLEAGKSDELIKSAIARGIDITPPPPSGEPPVV
jgi:hypothetical protein